jgi:hypothetical protein
MGATAAMVAASLAMALVASLGSGKPEAQG